MAGARILIVEDEVVVATHLEASVSKMGHQVVGIAASGEKALALLEKTRPDLVLLDIKLKGDLDGIQVAQEVNRTYAIPILFLSAYTDSKLIERAKPVRPFCYLTKPVDPRELKVNIEIALSGMGWASSPTGLDSKAGVLSQEELDYLREAFRSEETDRS